MADILINNLGLPTEDEQVNITILSDGTVIEHFRTEKGRWTSYRSGGVKAIELPSVGRWIDGQELKAFLKRKMCDVRCAEEKMNCDNCVISTLFKVIDKSPTLACEEGENPDGSDN